MPSPYDVTREELAALLGDAPPYRAARSGRACTAGSCGPRR